MLEPGCEPDLALEAVGAQRGGELGVEDLEGDGAVVAQVAREIDRGHAPAAELALERIPVLQGFTKLIRGRDFGLSGGGEPKIRFQSGRKNPQLSSPGPIRACPTTR